MQPSTLDALSIEGAFALAQSTIMDMIEEGRAQSPYTAHFLCSLAYCDALMSQVVVECPLGNGQLIADFTDA